MKYLSLIVAAGFLGWLLSNYLTAAGIALPLVWLACVCLGWTVGAIWLRVFPD